MKHTLLQPNRKQLKEWIVEYFVLFAQVHVLTWNQIVLTSTFALPISKRQSGNAGNTAISVLWVCTRQLIVILV